MPVQEGNDLGGNAGNEADLRPEKVMVHWCTCGNLKKIQGLTSQ